MSILMLSRERKIVFVPNMKHLLDGWRWGIALAAVLLWLASVWATEPSTNPIYSFGVAPELSLIHI